MEDFFDLCGGNDIIPVGEMTTMHQNNFVGESNPTRFLPLFTRDLLRPIEATLKCVVPVQLKKSLQRLLMK